MSRYNASLKAKQDWSHRVAPRALTKLTFGVCHSLQVKILNPFVPVDFAESAVRAIPDTEDFLKDIGHLVTEDEIMHLKSKEVTLEEKDFVDPTLVFEDESRSPATSLSGMECFVYVCIFVMFECFMSVSLCLLFCNNLI